MESRTQVQAAPSGAARGWHQEVAGRVAQELVSYPDGRLAKVSSLLHAFQDDGTHPSFQTMRRALEGEGVSLLSCGPTVSRRDVLQLGLASGHADTGPSDDIRVSEWRPGVAGRREVDLASSDLRLDEDGVIRWFDIRPPRDRHPDEDLGAYLREVDAYAESVTPRLEPWCDDLDLTIVVDLLLPDVQPKIETYGDERTGARGLSLAAMVTFELDDPDDDFDGVDERLVSQTVEMVVGPGWLLTCWHRSRTLLGSGRVEKGPPLLREPFMSHVAHRWEHEGDATTAAVSTTPSHLGLYLARSLAATYGASLRRIQRWVSTWEVEFYNTLGDTEKGSKLDEAAIEISDFLAMVGEFSRSVRAFKLAGEEMPNETWFPAPGGPAGSAVPDDLLDRHAKQLASTIETADKKLTQLAEEIRADMDLLMIHSQARQQEASERLQGYLGKVTGLVLVPTFVAGLFGANTALPGGGSWAGFDIMVLLMVLSAAVSYYLIRKLLA